MSSASNRHVLVVSILLLMILGGGLFYWSSQFAKQELGQQRERSNRPHVTGTRPAADEKNVAPVAGITADITLPTGAGIDPRTLEAGLSLVRVRDGAVIPSQKNTSGSGDALVLQPLDPLEKDTQYKFVVTPSLKDTSGASFDNYAMTFTTAKVFAVSKFAASFEKVEMPDIQLGQDAFTSLAIGPDGVLYAGSFAGMIHRFEIKPDGTLAKRAPIMTVLQKNGGPRLITGIAFDPSSTAEKSILWINHGQMAVTPEGKLEGADDWTGKLSRVFGPDFSNYDDVLVNLPRAFKDHMSFQMTFGKDGAMYFTQGSHTSVGDVDKKWGFRPERKLSAAVLRLDVKQIPAPIATSTASATSANPSPLAGEGRVGGAQGAPSTQPAASTDAPPPTPSHKGRGTDMLPIDVKTEDGGTYDPTAPNAPLTIYATGVRSGFDLLLHRNGHLYSGVNGAAGNEGNTPASPDGKVPAVRDLKETTDDTLLSIEAGAYYGHPNPTRGQYVLNGGNPTAGVDPLEVKQYPVGTMPDAKFKQPAFVFGKNMSPNGLIEYKGQRFGGALDGCILVTRYSQGKDIVVLRLNPAGEVIEEIEGVTGFTQFQDPLDILEDEKTGNLYVAEYRGQRIALLRPVEGKPSTQVRRTTVTPATAKH